MRQWMDNSAQSLLFSCTLRTLYAGRFTDKRRPLLHQWYFFNGPTAATKIGHHRRMLWLPGHLLFFAYVRRPFGRETAAVLLMGILKDIITSRKKYSEKNNNKKLKSTGNEAARRIILGNTLPPSINSYLYPLKLNQANVYH